MEVVGDTDIPSEVTRTERTDGRGKKGKIDDGDMTRELKQRIREARKSKERTSNQTWKRITRGGGGKGGRKGGNWKIEKRPITRDLDKGEKPNTSRGKSAVNKTTG